MVSTTTPPAADGDAPRPDGDPPPDRRRDLRLLLLGLLLALALASPLLFRSEDAPPTTAEILSQEPAPAVPDAPRPDGR